MLKGTGTARLPAYSAYQSAPPSRNCSRPELGCANCSVEENPNNWERGLATGRDTLPNCRAAKAGAPDTQITRGRAANKAGWNEAFIDGFSLGREGPKAH